MGSLLFFFFLQKKNSCLFLDFLPFSRTLEVKDIFNSLLPAAFPGGILSDTQEGPRRRTFFHYEPRLQQEKRWAEITNTHLANGACFSFSHRLHGVFKSTERRITFCVCCNTTILWRYFVTEAALSWTWTRVFCPLSVSGHTLKAPPNTWSLIVLILQVLRYKLGVLGFKEWGVSMKVAVQLSYGKWRIQCFWSLTHTKDWGYLPKEAFFFFFYFRDRCGFPALDDLWAGRWVIDRCSQAKQNINLIGQTLSLMGCLLPDVPGVPIWWLVWTFITLYNVINVFPKVEVKHTESVYSLDPQRLV